MRNPTSPELNASVVSMYIHIWSDLDLYTVYIIMIKIIIYALRNHSVYM